MRRPLHSTAICAEPSTWPAGWNVTRRAAERQRSRRSATACVVPAKFSP